jgi:hypothetical protein
MNILSITFENEEKISEVSLFNFSWYTRKIPGMELILAGKIIIYYNTTNQKFVASAAVSISVFKFEQNIRLSNNMSIFRD